MELAPEGFKIKYKIIDGPGREIYSLEGNREATSDIMPEVVNISLNNFPTGVYFIEQKVVYPKNEPTDSLMTIKKFFLLNPDKGPVATKYYSENLLFEKSSFSTYDDIRVADEIKKMLVIATDEEINQMKLLSTNESKQRYLFEFWRMRDPDTTTIVNERYIEFFKAIQYANIYFKTSFKQGWDTDRGKIMLKYGFPTERKVHDEIAGNNPYEEWFFGNVQGGVYFYFVDRSRLNNFKLFHSTAKSEPYYPEWYNDYVPIQSNKGNPDTKFMNDDDFRR
jgi:GWxTD domain-containing protein